MTFSQLLCSSPEAVECDHYVTDALKKISVNYGLMYDRAKWQISVEDKLHEGKHQRELLKHQGLNDHFQAPQCVCAT